MADSPVTTTQLDGMFKQVYGDDIPDLIPREMHIQNAVKFVPRQKELGNKYNQPVRLADSSGFTFAGADAGAFTLGDAKSLTLKNAQVSGAQIVLREQLDYESAARAASGRNAFKDATKYVFEGMQKSHRKMAELEYLYGGMELGKVASEASGVITIQTAEWAPGIWAGLEGAALDIFTSNLVTQRATGVVISAVDIDARTITVTGTYSSAASGDRIFLAGAKGNEMSGIHKILSNTGSLFGIDAASYSLWKGTSYAAGSAALSQAKIGAAIAKAVAKGLNDELMLMVNVNAWNNLLNDQAALKRFSDSSKKISGPVFVNGAEAIEFYSQNGVCKIVPSIYVKEGYAFGLCVSDWLRVGATDITMKTPGVGEQIFFHLPTKAGFEVRSYSNTAIFCQAPAKSFVITGVVNS